MLGDVRELRHDQTAQDRLIVDCLRDLVDASIGNAMSFGNFRPGAATYIKKHTAGTIEDPVVTRFVAQWGKTSQFSDDPMLHVMRNQTGPVSTNVRSDEMTYEYIQGFRVYEEVIEPAGLLDGMATFFRYPGSDSIRAYAFHRKTGQKEFGAYEHRLAALFIDELYKLYLDGSLEPIGLMDALPPRLTRIAREMATGKSQRQIAMNLNLSYHTVRSYSKELYDTAGVSSREALVAKLMKRS